MKITRDEMLKRRLEKIDHWKGVMDKARVELSKLINLDDDEGSVLSDLSKDNK